MVKTDKKVVTKFDEFKMVDGVFTGYSGEDTFVIKEILYCGSDGNVYVTYYDDGTEIEMIQYMGKRTEERTY